MKAIKTYTWTTDGATRVTITEYDDGTLQFQFAPTVSRELADDIINAAKEACGITDGF